MAKVLKDSLLKKIAKRVTFASKEFEIENGFELIERDPVQNPSINIDPFTGEVADPMTASITPVNAHTPYKKIVFSGVFDHVTEEMVKKGVAGVFPVGTLLISINSKELEDRGLKLSNFENAYGILAKTPTDFDEFGKPTSFRSAFYEIKSITPNEIKNYVIELLIEVELGKNDAAL